METEPMRPVTVYVEGVAFAILLIKQIFTNEDGSTGIRSLVARDTTLDVTESPQSIKNDERRVLIISHSNSMRPWRSRPRQRCEYRPTTSLRLCVVISNLNRSSTTPNSITLRASPNGTCALFNLHLLLYENSISHNWLRKVSNGNTSAL